MFVMSLIVNMKKMFHTEVAGKVTEALLECLWQTKETTSIGSYQHIEITGLNLRLSTKISKYFQTEFVILHMIKYGCYSWTRLSADSMLESYQCKFHWACIITKKQTNDYTSMSGKQ